jgi:hypothetical protein
MASAQRNFVPERSLRTLDFIMQAGSNAEFCAASLTHHYIAEVGGDLKFVPLE